ncbi:hypothetical protein [Aureispira sp. CCB-QB1]|nr:hypothetical protein [Aureispira sp. CCB-QB1]
MKKKINTAVLLYSIGLILSIGSLTKNYFGAKNTTAQTVQITQKTP